MKKLAVLFGLLIYCLLVFISSYSYSQQVSLTPRFKGNVMKWIKENTRKVTSDTTGTIQVEFSLDKSGKVKNVKLLNSLSPEHDKEAERVISSMPKWDVSDVRKIVEKERYVLAIKFD